MSSAVEAEWLPDHVDGDEPADSRGNRRRRSPRACDRCYRNACKCSPGIEGVTCRRCEEQDVECTYNRPAKRRGPPAGRTRRVSNAQPMAGLSPAGNTGPAAATAPPAFTTAPSVASASTQRGLGDTVIENPQSHTDVALYSVIEDSLDPETIGNLVEAFYHSIYPLRPYFHWPTFQSQVHRQLYRADWGVFIVTMAVCSLTAGRLSTGIVVSPSLRGAACSRSASLSSECYQAVIRALPADLTRISDLCSGMKAIAMLASVCIQNGDLKRAVALMGDYTSLVSMHGFHLEANWPPDLTEIQRQERRRLFWCVYQQEQYISLNFGVLARQREAASTVAYPAEIIDDKDITATSVQLRPVSDKISFLRGWNFCTDLYRVAENVDATMGSRLGSCKDDVDGPGGSTASFLSSLRPVKSAVSGSLSHIARLYRDLPPQLRSIKDVTGDTQRDRCQLVAANIVLTMSNIRMRLAGLDDSSVHIRCAIASELLDELGAAPPGFFGNASTGSLYHLAHLGHMLGSSIQSPISAWTYLQVRNILLVLADFLDKIEACRVATPNLAAKLRVQISRIDQCMQRTPQQYSTRSGLQAMGQSLLSEPHGSSLTNNTNGSVTSSLSDVSHGPPMTTALPKPRDIGVVLSPDNRAQQLDPLQLFHPFNSGAIASLQMDQQTGATTPRMSGLTRLLGITDHPLQAADPEQQQEQQQQQHQQRQQQQAQTNSDQGVLPLATEQTSNIPVPLQISPLSLSGPYPNPEADIILASGHGHMLANDFFDGWPILSGSGRADALDPRLDPLC